MGLLSLKSGGVLALAMLTLVSCVATPAPTTPTRPDQRAEAPSGPSAASDAFAAYYRNVEDRLVRSGQLRTDGGQSDAPFSAATLATNFERIALYDESRLSGGRFVAQQTASRLRRWDRPVRIQVHFGPSVSAERRASDRAIVGTYANRLSRITGHPISVVTSGGNFHVLFVSRDEQRYAAGLVDQLVPGVGDATLNAIRTLPRAFFCSAYGFFDPTAGSAYVASVAIIRAEHPDLLRRSCVHEEIAQGLGLPNDSPAARPSIFNDDDEFALLTPHDELLLRILYDPRLSIGMEPAQARPIVQRLAAQFAAGPS
jgi:hypothetical protein